MVFAATWATGTYERTMEEDHHRLLLIGRVQKGNLFISG